VGLNGISGENPTCVISSDLKKLGEITQINSSCAKMFGY